MKSKREIGIAIGAGILCIAIIIGRIALVKDGAVLSNACANISSAHPSSPRLIIEPDDGIARVLAAIRNARQSVDLVMYEFDDPDIESALVDARQRGAVVRVLLDSGYEHKPTPMNKAAYSLLQSRGVSVRWAPSYFALTHEKALIVDNSSAFIMSFNLVPKYYPTSRDFAVVDSDPCDVGTIERTFNGDWQGNAAKPSGGDNLVWSPGSRANIIAIIDSAKKSLDIYNEEMSDSGIINALDEAAQRGVAVNVIMTYSAEWKSAFANLTAHAVQVKTYAPDASLYIHAKTIIIDGDRAFVGSENFSGASLDDNRELGIIISDQSAMQSLLQVFNKDWKSGILQHA